MVTSRAAYLGFLAALTAERGFELLLSRRHERRLKARGGREVGARHFPAMVAIHGLFVPLCAAEVLLLRRRFPGALGVAAYAGALAAQGLRYWAVRSLGERWTVKVIVVPGEAPVQRGPYRFLKHPNYLAVATELVCVPLAHGAWLSALAFGAIGGALLRIRIRAEEAALGAPWAEAFARKPRLLPVGARP